MEVKNVRESTIIVPPASEPENPMVLDQAVNIINTVLGTQYRAFDKVRAVLTLAKATVAQQSAAEAAIVELDRQKVVATELIDATNQQLAKIQANTKVAEAAFSQAKAEQTQALLEDTAAAKTALATEMALEKAKYMTQITSDTKKAKEVLAVTNQNITSAQTQLERRIAEVQEKTAEADELDKRINSAKTAIAALRIKLGV